MEQFPSGRNEINGSARNGVWPNKLTIQISAKLSKYKLNALQRRVSGQQNSAEGSRKLPIYKQSAEKQMLG